MLIVYARAADAFGAEELDIFQRLSDELGFVIALEQGRATLQVTQVARRQAEETLRGVAELGPGYCIGRWCTPTTCRCWMCSAMRCG